MITIFVLSFDIQQVSFDIQQVKFDNFWRSGKVYCFGIIKQIDIEEHPQKLGLIE